MEKEKLIEKIDDLIKQATEERSHYYVKSLLVEVREYILSDKLMDELKSKVDIQKVGNGYFIDIVDEVGIKNRLAITRDELKQIAFLASVTLESEMREKDEN